MGCLCNCSFYYIGVFYHWINHNCWVGCITFPGMRYPKKRRFRVEWIEKIVEKRPTFWRRFIIWFKKSFWDK